MPDAPTLPIVITAQRDPALRAQLLRRVPMRYAAGADLALDRPAHVRAGSGMSRVGDRLAVIQDDTAFLALVDPRSGWADAVPLPADDDGRRQFGTAWGNKHRKRDHEACVALPPADGAVRVLAFGSGSTARREHVLVATFPDGVADVARVQVALVDAAPLYAALRAEPAFAGSELNVEGAALVDGRVRLFGRGNGAEREGVRPVSATCDLDADALLAYLVADGPPPRPSAIAAYALGAIDGVPLAFTDAAAWWPARGATDPRLLYAAAAERSPNVVDDGEVVGSAIGVLDADRGARWTLLLDEAGGPFRGKVEGVLADADSARLWIVTDGDDPDTPSELGEVEIGGVER